MSHLWTGPYAHCRACGCARCLIGRLTVAAYALTAPGRPALAPPPPSQNGLDRGWVLKGVDEVSLLLEDLGLNLQVRQR